MGRLGIAFRAFFAALGSSEKAKRIAAALAAEFDAAATVPEIKALPAPPAPKKPARSEALTLLAALQREARFVDIVQEPLDGYNDAQVGAAARDVLRDCRGVLERLFGLKKVSEAAEGETVDVPGGADPGRYRLTGNVSGGGARGKLVHHGWEASRCELPVWTGAEASARVVAPAEIELP